jgi:hypothetical protein
MRFALKHLFLLLFILGIACVLTFRLGPLNRRSVETRRAEEPATFTVPNLSILLTRQPGSDLLQLFVQNLDPQTAALISQEVFTLQRIDTTASIAHYTSSSPNHLSPSAISQPRADGTVLSKQQQADFQAWMRSELEARLKRLDQALQRRTKAGIFVALRMVHEQSLKDAHKQKELLPWVFLPAQQAPLSGAYDMQVQLNLTPKSFENLETFAKRLANEFQRRSSSPKSRP